MKSKYFASVILAVLALVCFINVCIAEAGKGSLKIIADEKAAKIYVDGNFEGTGLASIDKIIVGNHYVQVKLDDVSYFEEMVAVREGEQTTIVAKSASGPIETKPVAPAAVLTEPKAAQSQQPASRGLSVGLDASYGPITLTALGSSATSKTNPVGYGIFTRIPTYGLDVIFGAHYISKVSGVQISYAYLDLSGRAIGIVGSIGINYPLLSIDGISASLIESGIGYQAMIGYAITDYLLFGAKYVVTNYKLATTPKIDFQMSQVSAYLSIF